MPVPFTTLFAKNCVNDEKNGIDRIQNTIVTGKSALRGMSWRREWENGKRKGGNKKLKGEFERYLNIKKGKAGYDIKIWHDVIRKALETVGWLVLIGSQVTRAAGA
jgi:hypothetical protein